MKNCFFYNASVFRRNRRALIIYLVAAMGLKVTNREQIGNIVSNEIKIQRQQKVYFFNLYPLFIGMQNLSISCALVCLIVLGSAALVGAFGVCQHQISAVLVTGVMYLLAGKFSSLEKNWFSQHKV